MWSCLATLGAALAAAGAQARRQGGGRALPRRHRSRGSRSLLARRAKGKQDEQFDDLLAQLEGGAEPASKPKPKSKSKAPKDDDQFDDLMQELESGQSAAPAAASAPRGEIQAESRKKPRNRRGELNSIISELEASRQAMGDTSIPKETGFWADAKETVGWIFVSDFLLIIVLSFWFLLGVALKYSLGSEGVLEVFLAYWDPYFQAVLGVLFAIRLFSVLLSSMWGIIRGED